MIDLAILVAALLAMRFVHRINWELAGVAAAIGLCALATWKRTAITALGGYVAVVFTFAYLRKGDR